MTAQTPMHDGGSSADRPQQAMDGNRPSGISSVSRWLFALVLALNVVLSVAFSLVNPLYESTDELHNYRYMRYILATGRLPVLDPDALRAPRIQAHHPPLYYLLGAAATAWIRPDSPWDYEPVWNPYWGFHWWEMGADNKNHYLHGPEEAFPWRGTPLAARVARWVNVVLGGLMAIRRRALEVTAEAEKVEAPQDKEKAITTRRDRRKPVPAHSSVKR